MNKKGDETVAENAPIWLVLVILVMIVLLGVRYMATSGIYRELQIGNSEANILIYRIIFSDDCLAFNDSSRTYPGIIDLSKYTQSRLAACLVKPGVAVRLSLNNQSLYNDDYLFKSSQNECSVKKSTIVCLNKTIPVTIFDNGSRSLSTLGIKILLRNKEVRQNA